MAKRKAVQDEEVAGKTDREGPAHRPYRHRQGQIDGGVRLALRMLGRGKRVGVVQFIKGAWHTAERDALAKFGDQVVVAHDGRGLHLGDAGSQPATSPRPSAPGPRRES